MSVLYYLCMYTYIYVYIYVHNVYYIYTHISRVWRRSLTFGHTKKSGVGIRYLEININAPKNPVKPRELQQPYRTPYAIIETSRDHQ